MGKLRTGTVQPDGERIKHLLRKKGWYLAELIKKTRFNRRTIDKVVAGETVEIATLEYVARALGVPYESVVMGENGELAVSPGGSVDMPETRATTAADGIQPEAPPAANGLQLPISIVLGENTPPEELSALSESFHKAIKDFQEYKDLRRFVREFKEIAKTSDMNLDIQNNEAGLTIIYVKVYRNKKMFQGYIACPKGFEQWFAGILKATGRFPAFARVLHISEGQPSSLVKRLIKEEFDYDSDAVDRLEFIERFAAPPLHATCPNQDDYEKIKDIVRANSQITSDYVGINVGYWEFVEEGKRKPVFYAYFAYPMPLRDYMANLLSGDIPPGKAITMPEFARMVHYGEGRPSTEVKRWIKRTYGLDHDKIAKNGFANKLPLPPIPPLVQ
jgi:transcriptional regulator with XRE-family HTH domain